jgi:hypothetical protein
MLDFLRSKALENELKTLMEQHNLTVAQMRKAISDGVNATAKDVQAALQTMVAKRLQFRTPAAKKLFLQRLSKISQFSKPTTAKAIVSTVAIAGTVVLEMETGGQERPKAGKQVLMTPTLTARAGDKNKRVLSRFRFQALKLRRDGKALKGEKGTFAVRGVGIFQNTKRGGTKLIYSANPHRAIRKLLTWKRTAKSEVSSKLAKNIKAAVAGRVAYYNSKKQTP